jgi:aldose 1-epimerase
MITYNIKKNDSNMHKEVSIVCAEMTLSGSKGNFMLKFEFSSIGAALRRICFCDNNGKELRELVLSYRDVLESCHNTSLAGATIAPSAGRLPAGKRICFCDGDLKLPVTLLPNEGENQLHGGEHNLARENWKLNEVMEDEEGRLVVSFTSSLPDMTDGWSGNREFTAEYILSEDGCLDIVLVACSDRVAYVNMTNHTYWMRDGLGLLVYSNRMVENRKDFLPERVIDLETDCCKSSTGEHECITDTHEGCAYVRLDREDVYNNGFLLKKSPALVQAASLSYKDISLGIGLFTNAPLIVVYTGDYLDDTTVLVDGSTSRKGCAVALEPQEIFPFTETRLCSESRPFERRIRYCFQAL